MAGREYPDRQAAFDAAREEAYRTGEWAEVCRTYGPEVDGSAESWIVKPKESR